MIVAPGARIALREYFNQMTTHSISTPHAKITVIFLHGWCCSPNDFQLQMEYFKKQYSILLPDYSEAVLHFNLPSAQLFSWCVSELKATIESHKLEHFILVGHSMGGVLALALAEHFKSQHLGTVIIDTTIPITDEKRKKYNTIIKGLKSFHGESVLVTLFDNKWSNFKYDNLVLMQRKKNELISMWKKSKKNFTELMQSAVQYDSALALKMQDAPVLYIGGEPPNGDLLALKLINPNIQIAQIASGHFIMLNAADKLNALLEGFFTANKNRSAEKNE